MCVSERQKQSEVVKKCRVHVKEAEGVDVGDVIVQPNVRIFLRQRVWWARLEGGSRLEMTKGLKGGEERWKDNG